VLAGGRSRRFHGDKLRATVRGRSALARVVAAVGPLAADVIVVTSSQPRRRQLAALLPPSTRFSVDRPHRPRPGPAGAISQAIEELPSGPVLVVPGDVPWIRTEALRRFVRFAEKARAPIATVCWPSGETEHLFQWHRGRSLARAVARDRASTARASEFLRAARRALLVPVSLLTDDARSFRHLTRRSDLSRPSPRGGSGPWARTGTLPAVARSAYRRAHALLSRGRFGDAARAFDHEADCYDRAVLPILARHARIDAERARREAARGHEATVNRAVRGDAT